MLKEESVCILSSDYATKEELSGLSDQIAAGEEERQEVDLK